MSEPYRRYAYRDVAYLLNSRPGPLRHRPLAFAHRGADPRRENTMGAFRQAVDLGYRYLEIDVRTAADGTLVVFHDEELDRVTTGSGRLSEKTWDQLAQLRVGEDGTERLVPFEELLGAWDDVHLNVDLKDAAAVPEFARLVDEYQAHDRVLAASFNDARRRGVRRLLSRPIAASGGWASTALIVLLAPLGLVGRLGGRLAEIDCVQVPVSRGRLRVVTPRFVQRCHQAGLQVHVWVIDDTQEMHRLLDLGVDGLMTDDAAALAEVMRERSVWPQR